jgi:hypothetical protein
MTRPSEIKFREGSVPGTAYDGFKVGVALDELRFTITPEIVEEYIGAVQGDPKLYQVDGRKVAPPNVLGVYMTCLIYRTFPPIQGIVMYELKMKFHHPIWADEKTEIVAKGRVVDKFEKRGRYFINWEAEYRNGGGVLLATLNNTFNVPS